MRSYDYKARHETLSVNGLDVFYRHAGDRDKPGPLMLHGFPTSSHMYRKLIEPLARFRVSSFRTQTRIEPASARYGTPH